MPVAKDSPTDKEDITFNFKEITPEDWRANEAPLADLYTRGIVSQEYVRERLQIPEEAGQGTMFQPQAIPKPLQDIPKDAETLKIRTPTGREYTVERKRSR